MLRSKRAIGNRKIHSALMEVLEPRQMFSGYTVSDLGVGEANGINDSGQVVGNIPDAFGNGGSDAAYWDANGNESDISWGGDNGDATAINDSGEIVGWTEHVDIGGLHAFRMSNTQNPLKVGGPDFTYGDDTATASVDEFTAIDNSFVGLSVGYSNASSDTGIFYNGETFPVLGLPGQETDTFPQGISDYNTTTGNTAVVGDSGGHAFYSSGSTTVDITELLDSSSDDDIATAVSSNGNYVVGETASVPFIYYPSSNSAERLAISSGGANAVNNSGEMVGSFIVGGEEHAFYAINGVDVQDLNSLLPANSGWDLQDATGINSSGEICGYGTFEGQQHAFVLNPDTQGPTLDTFNVPGAITSQTSQPAPFSVAFEDQFGVQTSSLTASDFTVTGPSGKAAVISLSSVDSSDANDVITSWNIAAPGGTWNNADNGTYTVSLNSGAVLDNVGNASTGQTLFSFNVNVPIPATAPTISSLSASASSVVAGGNVTLTAHGVADINGNLSSVSFYRESNGGKVLIATDHGSSSTPSTTFSTSNLAPGTYTFIAQAEDTTDLTSNIVSTTVTVKQAGSISGTVFNDNNGNGAKDSNDAGLSGWRVYLDTNKDGVWETSESSKITSSTGAWSFTNLALGTYRVREVSQSGWRLTTPGAGYYDITLTSTAANVTAKLFGDTKSVAITGTVFADTNDNGKKDSTEKGVAGWTVYLDTNNDGKDDNGEKSVVTDANGNFSFTGLAAGTYVVRIVPKGSAKITDPTSGNYLLILGSGQADSGILFGEH